MAAAKAARAGQTIAPFAERAAAVARWAEGMTPDAAAAFVSGVAARAAAAAGAATAPSTADGSAASPSQPEELLAMLPADDALAAGRADAAGVAAVTGARDAAHPYRGRFSLHPLPDAFGPSTTGAH
jgi:hypothetical protein